MTWRQGSNRDDPVISELAWLSKQAASFNDQQDRTTVVLDEQLLQQELDAAAERAGEDAARMAAALAAVEGGLDYRETRSFGRTTYLAVFLDKPMPGFVPGSHVSVLSTHVDNDTGMFDTRLQILPADERHDVFRGSTWEEAASTTAALFGIDPACIHSVYDGFARSVLAKMLGHRESELSFQFPIA
jgi:hypothetical protein